MHFSLIEEHIRLSKERKEVHCAFLCNPSHLQVKTSKMHYSNYLFKNYFIFKRANISYDIGRGKRCDMESHLSDLEVKICEKWMCKASRITINIKFKKSSINSSNQA